LKVLLGCHRIVPSSIMNAAVWHHAALVWALRQRAPF